MIAPVLPKAEPDRPGRSYLPQQNSASNLLLQNSYKILPKLDPPIKQRHLLQMAFPPVQTKSCRTWAIVFLSSEFTPVQKNWQLRVWWMGGVVHCYQTTSTTLKNVGWIRSSPTVNSAKPHPYRSPYSERPKMSNPVTLQHLAPSSCFLPQIWTSLRPTETLLKAIPFLLLYSQTALLLLGRSLNSTQLLPFHFSHGTTVSNPFWNYPCMYVWREVLFVCLFWPSHYNIHTWPSSSQASVAVTHRRDVGNTAMLWWVHQPQGDWTWVQGG